MIPEATSRFLFSATRTLEVRFDSEVPPEVVGAISPLIEKHAWVVPSYINLVFVRWSSGDGEAALSATAAEDYRRMTLWVHGCWLSNSVRGRDNDVRHELLHAATEPLFRFGQKMIDWTAPEEKVRQLLKEELRTAVEKVTCDLQNMLDRQPLQA